MKQITMPTNQQQPPSHWYPGLPDVSEIRRFLPTV